MRFPFAMLVALSITACSEGTPSTPEPDPGPEPAESGPRYITLDGDALETARTALARRDPDAKLDIVDMWNGVAVVRYDAQDFKALSQEMHENHNRCGGFMLHDSLDDALVALRAKDNEGLAPLLAYTIDNGATVNALLPQLNQTSLLGVIQQLSSYPTRYYTSTTGVQAANWLRDQWTTWAAGRADVSVSLFTHPTWAQPSVIATITGTTLPSEVVVVGGHLDSINQSGGNAPGADDDASGIATLSEVYRVLMTSGYRPARTVKFMAYAAEEVGLRGSAAIAAQHQSSGVNVVGVMQLDMTNYKGSDKDIWLMQDYTNAAASLANLIACEALLPLCASVSFDVWIVGLYWDIRDSNGSTAG